MATMLAAVVGPFDELVKFARTTILADKLSMRHVQHPN